MKDILKMKGVIDRANKYSINIDLVENGIIEEEKNEINNNINNINKQHDIKNGLKNNSYNVSITNNNKDSIYKNSGKKEKFEKSPTHYSNKAKNDENSPREERLKRKIEREEEKIQSPYPNIGKNKTNSNDYIERLKSLFPGEQSNEEYESQIETKKKKMMIH